MPRLDLVKSLADIAHRAGFLHRKPAAAAAFS